MSHSRSLQPLPPDPLHVRLATLEAQVEARERELAAVKADLRALQADYFERVGAMYTELNDLDAAVEALEIALGLRPPPADDGADEDDGGADGRSGADDEGATGGGGAGCSNRGAPSADLKRVFRDLAKAVHPDRAAKLGEAARYRRHSLMAEANRAYAERDEDRLRLILRAWERSTGDEPGGPDEDHGFEGAGAAGWPARSIERRIAWLDDRLIAIDAEFADLRASAIWRLKARLDESRAQGWDLLAEIVNEVKRQVARQSARLAALRRMST
ncbi:MAG: J domain-containing protein [Vicinamibacterales bacterium]